MKMSSSASASDNASGTGATRRPDDASAQTLQIDARAFLAACARFIDERLDAIVPAATVEPTLLHDAIRWSLLAPGKRIRPALVVATGESFGADRERLATTACAYELLHTYSLIHDDLPAMDDDRLRRGRPTCHVKFDESTAILAGDALQALAFQVIAEDEGLAPVTRVRLVAELARAAGTPEGMVAGQTLDLAAEARDVTGIELEAIHRRKTGALLVSATRAGAIIADATHDETEAVGAYASHLGLLFQITDDLLDITATAAELGKTPGKDAGRNKATYPALHGVEGARRLAADAHRAALAALDKIDRPLPLLRSLATMILERRA